MSQPHDRVGDAAGTPVGVVEAGVEAAYAGQEMAGLPRVELAKWVDFTIADEVLAELGTDDTADPAGR